MSLCSESLELTNLSLSSGLLPPLPLPTILVTEGFMSTRSMRDILRNWGEEAGFGEDLNIEG